METEVLLMKNVIKRNGKEVKFDLSKIVHAIEKANKEVDPIYQLNAYQIQAAADSVVKKIQTKSYAVNVEEIQDMVEEHIMQHGAYEVAKAYITYRYTKIPRSSVQHKQTTRFFRLSSLTTRKLNRRTPIRILLSIPLRETTWLER